MSPAAPVAAAAAGPAAGAAGKASLARAGAAGDVGFADISDPTYRRRLRSDDAARARAYDTGRKAGRAAHQNRRPGQRRRPRSTAPFDDAELADLHDAGADVGWSDARRARRAELTAPARRQARSLVADGSTAVLLLLGWAVLLNYLQGGPGQVRGWLAAKFLNRPYGDDTAKPGGALVDTIAGAVETLRGFRNPVPGGRYSHDFGSPRSGGRTHQGIDIFAPAGTPVLAAMAGVVGSDFDSKLGGNVVRVAGVDGNSYYYAHLQDGSIAVAAGQHVNAGDRLGQVGATGNAAGTAPHLHFSINEGSSRVIDPWGLLERLG